MRLPSYVMDIIKDVCRKYNNIHPNGMPHEAFGPALNEICYLANQDSRTTEPYGLSEKRGGKNVPFLDTYVAEDVIQLKSGHHWDIFGGAQTGARLNPSEFYHGIISPDRKWIAPVNPGNLDDDYDDTPTEPDIPTPTRPPVNNPLPPDGDLTNATQELERYYKNQLNRPMRETPVDELGYARWIGFDYIFSRQQGMNHEQALDAMFRNIIAITGIPRE